MEWVKKISWFLLVQNWHHRSVFSHILEKSCTSLLFESLLLLNVRLELLSIYNYFEVQLDSLLPYDRHVEQALSTVGMRLNALYWSRRCLSEHNRKQVGQLFLLPIIDYRDVILSTMTTVVYHLVMQYNKLCRSILLCNDSTECCDLCNPKSAHCWELPRKGILMYHILM